MNVTYTENGATQLRSSGNRVLDFFAEIASSHAVLKSHPKIVIDIFVNALVENAKQAFAVMFWIRAVRLGAGQRDIFDALFAFAYKNYPEFIKDNLELIGELGYFKDYVRIFDKYPELEGDIVEIFVKGIASKSHFAAKWLPRNTSLYSLVRNKLNMKNADFRRLIAKLSTCVEQKICAKKIEEIEYSKIPSKAFNIYKKLFLEKDRDRFIKSILSEKINTQAIYPHEVFKLYNELKNFGEVSDDMKLITQKQWDNLSNFINPKLSFLPILDTSGSMYAYNINDIAFSLGIYCAEKQEGIFNNKIISFSQDARYFDLTKCKGVLEKLEFLEDNSIVESTNIASVFELILDTAISANLPKEKMPNCLLILSDMQFNDGAYYDITLVDELKLKYKYAGYDFPAIIYWNLSASNTGIADDKNSNVAFVSGFNPKILESVFSAMEYEDLPKSEQGESVQKLKIDPQKVMENAIKPIEEMLKFDNLKAFPESFKDYDYNPSRGYSARLRRRKISQLQDDEKAENIIEALEMLRT